MAYVGGTRQRLIENSLYFLVRQILSDLGWLDEGRKHRPLVFVNEDLSSEADRQVELNTVAVTDTDTGDRYAELGSQMGEVRTTYYVDFYAENDAISKDVIHDIRDGLIGRMSSIGRTASVLKVYDYTLATPAHIFTCDLEEFVVDKAHNPEKSWQKHWRTCRLTVVDYYTDDQEDE